MSTQPASADIRPVEALSPPPARHADGGGRARRVERWLWTGPIGHLLGGSLDFIEANARYALARLRRSRA